MWTELLGNEDRHAALDPKLSCFVTRGHDHLVVKHDHSFLSQVGVVQDLSGREEHIHVDVDPSAVQGSLVLDLLNDGVNSRPPGLPVSSACRYVGNAALVFSDPALDLEALFLLLVVELRVHRTFLDDPLDSLLLGLVLGRF